MTDQNGRLAVAVIAVVFALAGVLGLASGNHLDVVHLGFGVTGLAVVRSARGTRRFLIGGGVLYVVWHFVIANAAAPISLSANDWLNLWLAASMIALACLIGDRPAATREKSAPPREWRRERVCAASPGTRPRRPRAAAGNRPSVRRRSMYSPA